MASAAQPPSLPLPLQASNVAGGGWNSLQRASLYVGDLDPDVTETDLINKFSAIAPVSSLRLCRCLRTRKSLRYAYINFFSHFHARKAFACLNHTDLKGKPMRIMWSQRDPFPRKIGIGNLFVKNLDPSISSACLEGIFCRFGTILSCKIAEENGKSKGFGFVQFDSEGSAMAAMTALHDTMLEGRKLYVAKFVRKSERTTSSEEEKFTNLYVKNLFDDMTEDLLKEMFSRYGKVCSVVIMKDGNGMSRGFGFVNFQSPDDAKKALEAMNGLQLGSKNLFVGRAQKKAERTKLLKNKYKDVFNCRFEKLKASNLYVKNLNDSIDDKRLQEVFGRFGRITSARVMRLENGRSKGFGFVCFSSPEEATAALHGLNGTFFEGKFLYVAVAQRKEDRCKELQYYYMQNTPDQMRHVHPSIAGIRRDCMYKQHSMTYNSNVRLRELDHVNSGSKKVGFRKKGNKRCEPAENSSVALAAIEPVTAATSPGNSENNENLSHPFVENLKPEHAAKVSGVLLEMNSDVLKLLNSPNSLAIKGKPVQVLKEANARTGTDAVTFTNPKSARCLSY
ncbi:hypothetical protein Gorai_005495 [Gossypium raimondii]|uniref:RRM domain-containing protein n=1 Tax=Gossypium raimondii TaxID=29730 RepID=A0A7J8QCF6_GOSRA|nr:hypothetical protein [Gossypium raimondii]